MLEIRINGRASTLRGESLPKLADVVELVKGAIDPDHMITALALDGAEPSEEQWYAPVSGFRLMEVETDTPGRFVAARLAQAPEVVAACYAYFRDARKTFREGDTRGGNTKLVRGVHTLKAFFEWYATVFHLVPASDRGRFDIDPQVREILVVCQEICKQQLYQSWWAIGESIEKELEPRLDELENFFRKAVGAEPR